MGDAGPPPKGREAAWTPGCFTYEGRLFFSYDFDFLAKHETIRRTLGFWSEPGGPPREDVARVGLGAQRPARGPQAEERRALPEREPRRPSPPPGPSSCGNFAHFLIFSKSQLGCLLLREPWQDTLFLAA